MPISAVNQHDHDEHTRYVRTVSELSNTDAVRSSRQGTCARHRYLLPRTVVCKLGNFSSLMEQLLGDRQSIHQYVRTEYDTACALKSICAIHF
jgi:hypothetical protein